MKKLILCSTFLLAGLILLSQDKSDKIVYTQIINGDTLYIIPLDEVKVKSTYLTKRRYIRRTNRLIRYIKKVYPYAQAAKLKLQEYDSLLKATDKASDRRKLMRQAEREIKEEYGADLKKLTFTQGKILLKLIDRETGDSSFELVKDLRGGFAAFFYQSFARIFGFNLKVRYDPTGKDRKIEEIVRLIEKGQL